MQKKHSLFFVLKKLNTTAFFFYGHTKHGSFVAQKASSHQDIARQLQRSGDQ
jgi:hypothetical protein